LESLIFSIPYTFSNFYSDFSHSVVIDWRILTKLETFGARGEEGEEGRRSLSDIIPSWRRFLTLDRVHSYFRSSARYAAVRNKTTSGVVQASDPPRSRGTCVRVGVYTSVQSPQREHPIPLLPSSKAERAIAADELDIVIVESVSSEAAE